MCVYVYIMLITRKTRAYKLKNIQPPDPNN